MKNSISKSLIYGVIASSLIMVNCQKAPDRSLKVNTSSPSVDGKLSSSGSQPQLKTAECSPSVVKERDTLIKIKEAILAKTRDENKKVKEASAVSSEDKNLLLQANQDLDNQCKVYVGEFSKQAVDNCTLPAAVTQSEAANSSRKSSGPITKEGIEGYCNNLSLEVSKITGVQTERAKQAQQVAQSAQQKQSGIMVQGTKLVVSDELISKLEGTLADAGQFLMDGQIVQDQNDHSVSAEAMKDQSKSLCYFTAFDKLVKGDVLVVTQSEVKTKSSSASKKIIAASLSTEKNGRLLGLECVLASDKIEVEFKKAVGGLLKQATSDAAKKVEAGVEQKAQVVLKTSEEEAARQQKAAENRTALNKAEAEIAAKAAKNSDEQKDSQSKSDDDSTKEDADTATKK